MIELWLEPAAQEEILAHCLSAHPKEACGLLAGNARRSPGEPERRAAYVYPMRNVEDSPIGYAMDPKEQLTVEKTMRQRQQRLLGIYHSHTQTEAYPSPVDVSLAISPDLSYVLVSLKTLTQPDLRSYRIDGAKVLEEPVHLQGFGHIVRGA